LIRKGAILLLTLVALVLALDKGGAMLMGAQLRASGQIPAAYLAQLPETLNSSGLNRNCKRYTVGRFWSYQLCLDAWGKLPPCEASPMFTIEYWAPPMNLLAGWKEFYFNIPYGEHVSVIDSEKHECAARTPEGWTAGNDG